MLGEHWVPLLSTAVVTSMQPCGLRGRYVTTAHEVLTAAIRTGLSPELRKLGFTGSGQVFELPDSRVWLLLGIQKSSGATAARLRFTINVAAVSKEKWQEVLDAGAKFPGRPSPNKVYGKWAWWKRVGELMPGGQDFWWTVTNDTESDDLARRVLSACVDYAVPALQEQRRLNE
ncbi:DUF4304 domain-containing protein [Streptomyces tropicalis]|uniref:DUF4304 domain-containing protein n=1 Tax=Streptomyces tropicalis TaxID=3034234 RepID=A0ABT6AAG4_9ACTN|nr:DUF4304 domain-containing protein [Streptomyces tropicalis]MDF3301634.1 DUF4304 domain-containing protein [Streptomyces tropicalis]